MIVGLNPFGGCVLNMMRVIPAILGQPILANRPVEFLYVDVLLWLTWLDVFKSDYSLLSPFDDRRTEVLRSLGGVSDPRSWRTSRLRGLMRTFSYSSR